MTQTNRPAGATRRTRRWRGFVAVAAVALLATGCGGDDDEATSSTEGATTVAPDEAATTLAAGTATPSTTGATGTTPRESTTTAAAGDPLGPVNQATGSSVKLGFVTSEAGSVDIPETREAAEAVVAYANERLNGLAGHEIELVTCQDKGDGASATACANMFVEQGVAAVVAGQVPNPDLYMPILATASIPWVVEQGAGQQELTSDGAYVLSGGAVSIFGAAASWAAENGMESIVVFGVDVPAFTGLFGALGQPEFEAQGVSVDLVLLPPTAPDVTPQIAAGMAASPDGVITFGGPTLCKAMLPAIDNANLDDVPVVIPGPCATTDVFDAVGVEVVDGDVVFGVSVALGSSPEAQLYEAVLDEYAPETEPGLVAGIGFVSSLGLIRAVNAAPPAGDLTPVAITEALRAAKDVPLPGFPGGAFTCDQAAHPIFKALCSTLTITAKVEGGELVDFATVEG